MSAGSAMKRHLLCVGAWLAISFGRGFSPSASALIAARVVVDCVEIVLTSANASAEPLKNHFSGVYRDNHYRCCWRNISNKHTAVAEATLGDSPGCMGMVNAASACASNSALKPAPSLPISHAFGRLKSC